MRMTHADAVLNVPPGRNDVPYPTKLELVRNILGYNAEVAAGTVIGTGNALDVTLPFDPGFVWACKTAGVNAPVQVIKHPGFPDDDCIKMLATGAASIDTAGLITLGAPGEKRFTIGPDVDLNQSAQPIRWLAIGFRNYGGFQ